jgi:hypothetical protein
MELPVKVPVGKAILEADLIVLWFRKHLAVP